MNSNVALLFTLPPPPVRWWGVSGWPARCVCRFVFLTTMPDLLDLSFKLFLGRNKMVARFLFGFFPWRCWWSRWTATCRLSSLPPWQILTLCTFGWQIGRKTNGTLCRSIATPSTSRLRRLQSRGLFDSGHHSFVEGRVSNWKRRRTWCPTRPRLFASDKTAGHALSLSFHLLLSHCIWHQYINAGPWP